MLLCLQHVTEDGNIDDITKMILGAFTNEGGLTPYHIKDRFMLFGTDDASVLQWNKNSVTKNCIFLIHHTYKAYIVWHIKSTLQCSIYQIWRCWLGLKIY